MAIAELRLDFYSSREEKSVMSEFLKFKRIPVIATIRSRKEGGRWNGSEEERLHLFEIAMPHADAVDIELSSKSILKDVIRKTHREKKVAIVSYHNFEKTPDLNFLRKILKQAKAAGADIVKIATMAKSKKDVIMLAEFTSFYASQNLITFSMGKVGAVSRILFPSLGSLLTFAYVGRSTAPGQWDLRTTSAYLKKLYI